MFRALASEIRYFREDWETYRSLCRPPDLVIRSWEPGGGSGKPDPGQRFPEPSMLRFLLSYLMGLAKGGGA